jgi:hypothetical protein
MDASRFDRLTRRLAGRTTRRTAVGTSLFALALGGLNHVAAGHQATPAPDATPVAEGEEPVFLFVQTFASGRGDINPAAGTPVAEGTPTPGPGGGARFLVTLEGHTGQTIYFSDRPDRIVGATPTDDFLQEFGFYPDNPPNAALVAEFKTGQGVVVVELIEPRYDADAGTVTYGAEVLEGYEGENLVPVVAEQVAERLPAEFSEAALFIDDCPIYTSCLTEVWASFGGEPVFLGLESVGPIPNGPYKACFNKDTITCASCDTTLQKLTDLCNAAYPDMCMGNCVPGS